MVEGREVNTEVARETNEAYHADQTHVGHSMKEVFRQSRRLYQQRFITAEIEPPEETPAMQLGTAVHCRCGEPDEFEKRYIVAPKVDRRTNEGKALWQHFQEQAAGRTLLTPEQWSLVHRVSDAVLESPLAKDLWTCAGPHELTFRWNHLIKRKCRFDKLIDDCLAVDLKTAIDPRPGPFATKMAKLGYARQAAWYLDGLQCLTGERGDFVFLVVGTEPPHEVFAYEPTADDLDRALAQNERAIEAMADCYESNVWRTPGADEITKLALPNWSRYDDYAMED